MSVSTRDIFRLRKDACGQPHNPVVFFLSVMNIGANEGASDQESRFFSSLFFCFFTNINNLSIHAHDDCSWPGSKSHFFRVVGYNWRVSGMFGGEYHIILVYFSGLVPQRISRG